MKIPNYNFLLPDEYKSQNIVLYDCSCIKYKSRRIKIQRRLSYKFLFYYRKLVCVNERFFHFTVFMYQQTALQVFFIMLGSIQSK